MSDHTIQRLSQDMSTYLLENLPVPVMVVDRDVTVIAWNRCASELIGDPELAQLRKRSGEIMHCLNSRENGCGMGDRCKDCGIRQAVTQSFGGQRTDRRQVLIERQVGEKITPLTFLITTAPVQYLGHPYVMMVLQDVSELVQLRKLLPICARCKRIRDDQQYWHQMETYMQRYLQLDLTHGYCPECYGQMVSELEHLKF